MMKSNHPNEKIESCTVIYYVITFATLFDIPLSFYFINNAAFKIETLFSCHFLMTTNHYEVF